MRFGICGYGNIGKAVEEIIVKEKRGELVIFSRRKGLKSPFETPIYSTEQMSSFREKIDVMIMCGGSKSDLMTQSPLALENFNIIDTFDTHALTHAHAENLRKVAKKCGKVAIYSCGWDPGIFSIFRTLSKSIFSSSPETFWGKGVSQGHSEALRSIDGVKDAISFTIPKREMMKEARKRTGQKLDENQKHKRLCYVCLQSGASEEKVKEEILNMPNYFNGQEVAVHFCEAEIVKLLKQKMSHRGIVLAGDGQSMLDLKVRMRSNPHFTAQILLAYAGAAKSLPAGAYSPLDIPISLLGEPLL